jgi:uncharacterized protein
MDGGSRFPQSTSIWISALARNPTTDVQPAIAYIETGSTMTSRTPRTGSSAGRSLLTSFSGSRPIALALLAGLAVLAGCEGLDDDRFMSIGTAGTGGVYYVLGGALASELTRADPERQYNAEVTGGSVENLNRIREGQQQIGMVMALSAYEAYNGGVDYPEPLENLRVLAPLYGNVTHVMVRRNLEIARIRDLRDLRVAVGTAGSGTEQMARQLLEAAGLTYDDVRVRYLSFAESAAALQDGAIDAAILSVGYPAAAVLEATTTGGARLLALDDDVIDALRERYPYYARGAIEAGVYRGVTEPVPTVVIMNWLVGRDDLPDEVVETLLDVLVTRHAALVQVHEMARQIDLGDLADAPIPLHRVAEAWRSRDAERAVTP